MLESLKNEKVFQVECGEKHSICKTTLNSVYTWGWGHRGQLGHSTFDSENTPRLLKHRLLT